MFNRAYGYQGQAIVLTQEDLEIMAAADDRSNSLRAMVDAEDSDFDEFGRCLHFRLCREDDTLSYRAADQHHYYAGGNRRDW